MEGGRLSRICDLAHVEVCRPLRLRELDAVRSVVIVGGSCAGKSTFAWVLQRRLPGPVEVVPRITTRAPRAGDDSEGTTAVDTISFDAIMGEGGFVLAWDRPMSDGAVVRYGCVRPSDLALVPVLTAGHGIYTNASSVRPRSALDGAVVVGVHASPGRRRLRFERRSPDVIARGREEVRRVLEHDDAALRANVDLLVVNDGPDGSVDPALSEAILDGVRAVELLLRR